MPLNILFIGDVIGRPGRKKLREVLPSLKKELDLFFIIANGENLAGGLGINRKVAQELFEVGVDVITTGNHVWRNKEAYTLVQEDHRVLRPLNLPPGNPGNGYGVYEKEGVKIAVFCLLGRTFMSPAEHPFLTMDKALEEVSAPIKIVDFHAEATSEKKALGYYLDGRVSAVLGTHTHVTTADERILPKGTLYITDVGMTGPKESVIGMDVDVAIKGFLTLMPFRFTAGKGEAEMNAVLFRFDDNLKPVSIERIRR